MVEAYKKIPAVLQKQILIRLAGSGLGVAMLILILAYRGDWRLIIPGIAIFLAFAVDAALLFRKCKNKRYVMIHGICQGIDRTGLRKRVKAAYDGAAVMLAMMPLLMADQEFEENFGVYFDQRKAGFPDLPKATNAMAILCDNAYRRIKDDACPMHIKVELQKSGNVLRVSQAQLDAGHFKPNTVVAGEFTIFARTGRVTMTAATAEISHTDFEGQYQLTPSRKLSFLEEQMVPKLEDWYIIPDQVVNICKHAKVTTGKPMQMRNFLMRGPAGTGKTQGAMAVAAGLHLPYMKYTCSASTEVFDFVGMVFPNTESMSTGDEELDKQRDMLMQMGGINYTNVAKLMNLPDLEDMDFDPAGVFHTLTGVNNEDATSRDCMAVVMDMVAEKIKQLSKPAEQEGSTGQTYTYVETDFIKALKNGYVVEIQEPTVITQPGVLVGLNSLLEQSGSITLPTGEIIKRHPDTVVIVTTNVSYEGCRGLNQSVVDRMSLVEDVELPSPEVMAQRAMAVTGAEDEAQVIQMVQVVNDMSDYMRKNGITDGTCGMRSLIDWIISTEITGDENGDLDMLDLGYACTVHKSQGSEYKSVIINLQCAHSVMLVRPLIYTAITRAKERVLIVGERRALCTAIRRIDTEQRGTKLAQRIIDFSN